MIDLALKSLGIDDYVIKGIPTNESEFNRCFKKVTGKDSINQAILSTDPSDFGVTWKQVADQIEIEKEKKKNEQYKQDRKAEFDSKHPIGDQLDYIFHNGLAKWKSDIVQPVKDKFPKPE